jgi:hypothetical protein
MREETNANNCRPAAGRNRLPLAPFMVWVAMLLLLGLPALAQDTDEGVNAGNYNIRQSFEFGYRVTDFTGDPNAYNTFVDLGQGPRLLDFTLDMHSLNHVGSLFDRFYLSNFGYGGDPDNVSRLRVSKDKWYEFNALFRRDENNWDYSLFANPLNPTSTFTNAPAGFNPVLGNSPHLFETVRKLGNYDLTLLPQSKVSFRLGYSHNSNDGPSFSSYHQGTEALLLQNWRTTENDYRLGVDFHIAPRTNISYDQFWNYFKGDTSQSDQNQLYQLANGTPVDIGVSLNNSASQPCGGTFTSTGAVNPTCNAFIAYTNQGRVRTNIPTEQISFQSNYFKNLQLSGRFSYGGGDMNVYGYQQTFAGRESRTNLSNFADTAPISGKHVEPIGDFGATWYVTRKFRVLDTFNYSSFRDPATWDSATCEFFSTNMLTAPNLFTPGFTLPVTCGAPANGVAGTPAHSTSSSPDVSVDLYSGFLKQEQEANLFQLEYDFTRKFGAHLGYRFRHRDIFQSAYAQNLEIYYPSNANRGDCALVAGALPEGCTANGDGSFTFLTPGPIAPDVDDIPINEHSGLFGFWARPTDAWRINFDTSLTSADNSYTRISPREWQEYHLGSSYKVNSWLSLSGSTNIVESRNNVTDINNLQHDRTYGMSAMLQPKENFFLELGYEYNDVYAQTLVCFVATPAPVGVDISTCPVTGLSQALSVYTEDSHFGYFDLMWKPVKKLTAHFGGNITESDGSALFLNSLAPSGPLDSHFYRPSAGIDYDMVKHWTGRAYWGYYGYTEAQSDVPQDIFFPRTFRGNMVTLSMRYSF